MKRTTLLFILLMFTVLLLAGCKPAEPVCGAQIADSGTHDNTCGLGVPQGANSAELFIQAKLKHGRMSWELEDPTGKVVWSGFANWETPANESKKLENPLPGRWTLRVHTDAVTGEYTAPWVVR